MTLDKGTARKAQAKMVMRVELSMGSSLAMLAGVGDSGGGRESVYGI
jgi:hypothetical protein